MFGRSAETGGRVSDRRGRRLEGLTGVWPLPVAV